MSEFTDYSITAAGFDVIEKKLDERDRARSTQQAVREPDNGFGNEFAFLHAAAVPPQEVAVNEPRELSIVSPATPAVRPEPVSINACSVKRVVFSMGGKGGVGKTSVITGLAEWYEENNVPATLLDLDIENKVRGSLGHFFSGKAPKINIHTPAGLDAFIDHLADDTSAIVADMGAGAGHVAHDWFQKMYPDVAGLGVAFTAIGVVTNDPASVESVLRWAAALEDRVSYVIVHNHLTQHTDFSYWNDSEAVKEFCKRYQPAILNVDFRLADLENAIRAHGVTLGRVVARSSGAAELQRASLVMRAQSYRRRMFAEFDKVRDLLIP